MQLAARKPAEVSAPRMRPLAKLPVFLDLAGKRAVVAGGTAAAAWKVELLAAAGADVEVYAPTPGPEMAHFLGGPAPAGTTAHHARPWSTGSFAGAAVAVADIDDEAEARAFCCAARAAGVPVNIVDKPEFCRFQFGSIVNRSPVVVGISTDGAAPILAQAIRRRIETLLPASLAAWGELAGRIRATVLQRLGQGEPRRRFWEKFADRAFAGAPEPDAERDLERRVATIARTGDSSRGRVTLVGAGPGDAELLTLKALRALQSADVILFDDLVSDEVLELARREARRMLVGKRGRRESCRQRDINALMLKLARQGKHVVRLKSGDPMIFGRAGEEIAELARHGIAVDVVPGITAAAAAAAALGVSLTHRDFAQSVRFVTGHARNGGLPADLDWTGLADPATTLVLYMAGRTGPAIAGRLIAAGLPPATPAVVLIGVSRPDEVRWQGDLAALAQDRCPIDLARPVLIGIGPVFAASRMTVPSASPGHSEARGGVQGSR